MIEEITIISLYSITRSVFCNRKAVCLLCGTNWITNYFLAEFKLLPELRDYNEHCSRSELTQHTDNLLCPSYFLTPYFCLFRHRRVRSVLIRPIRSTRFPCSFSLHLLRQILLKSLSPAKLLATATGRRLTLNQSGLKTYFDTYTNYI
jgi:hypothetical protein